MSDLLSRYTTFQLGGPCKRLIHCETPAQLEQAIGDMREPFLLIGGGSNLLVADKGLDAVVIRYFSAQPRIEIADDELIVTGSTLLDDLAAFAVGHGLEGLVCCTGIPGTVGGAIAGNAGAFGEQIGDRLVSVDLIKKDGTVMEEKANSLGFAYRASRLQRTKEIVLSARIKLQKGDRARLQKHRQDILDLRASKHPDWKKTPTAGSFFKNIEPTSKAERRQAAGWFLEQVGAKQMRVGGARVYEKHGNIIIADEGCTAQNVIDLAAMMAKAVKEQFNLELQREVQVIGL